MTGAVSTSIYWTTRKISPSNSRSEKYSLRLLHVFAAGPGRSLDADLLTQYPDFVPAELNLEQHDEISRAWRYLLKQLAAQSSSREDLRLFTFVLPYTSGYIVRSDFLRTRLQVLQRSHQIHTLREPLERCEFREFGKSHGDLVEILDTAVGVISTAINRDFDLNSLQDHLRDRLIYPWLSLKPIAQSRVALVRGRPNYRVGQPVYSAAQALGVALVIIDEDGHWLQAATPENEQLREAFLTIDMAEDHDLPNRIATAVKNYPARIDGIFTLSDNYLVAVAQTVELLGLPSSPSSAYEIACDKGLSRRLSAAPHEYANVMSEEALLMLLASKNFRPQYPLIVKPRTRGWNSMYVRKVHAQEELLLAVRDISPKYSHGVVIEPYYDGPEVDVNMVISDGRVAFQEIVDEPPSRGDLTNESTADFLENGMRAPSILPEQEQQSIFDSISKTLLKVGFTDGIFHVEARISGSSMELRNEGGSIDLVSTSPTPSENVRTHLIEINARPPGLRAQILTQLTYGIDYFAVKILSAVKDIERMEASCHPFSVPSFPQGAQSWFQLIHLPVLSKGIATGFTGIERFLHQLPGVAPYVLEYQCCFEAGEALPDPAEHMDFFGHCIVSSMKSRRHVVEIADELLKEYYKNGVESTVAPAPYAQRLSALDPACEKPKVLEQCLHVKRNSGPKITIGKWR